MKISFQTRPYTLPPTSKELGRRIREVRMARGWSQTDLGGLLDVAKQTISAWEQGKNSDRKESWPSIPNLARFSVVAKINLGDLLS